MKNSIEDLKKRHEEIYNHYSCSVPKEAYSEVDKFNKIIAQFSIIENRRISVFDFSRRKFIINGYRSEDRLDHPVLLNVENETFDAFCEMVHPSDLYFVVETGILAHDFIHSIPVEERIDYKLNYEFRMKNNYGEYVWVGYQIVVNELDAEGRIWLVLLIANLLPNQNIVRKPKRELVNVRTGEFSFFFDDQDIAHKKKIIEAGDGCNKTDVGRLRKQGNCRKTFYQF